MRIGLLGPIATDSVAALLPPLPPGVPRGATSAPMLGTLIEALLALGHEVVAFTLAAGQTLPPAGLRLAGERFTLVICPARSHAFRLRDGRPGRALDAFRDERAALVAALRREQLDVVHAHWLYEYAAAALDAAPLPAVITAHDDPWRVLRHMPGLYRLARFLLARRVMRAAPVLTAVSPSLARRLAAFTRRPVESIANPLPAALLAGELHVAAVAAVPRGDPTIGMVLNGWSALKNAGTALRAFARLRRWRPEARLLAFGADFEEGGPAQRWARAHGCAEGVCFLGEWPRPRLLEALAGLDLLVHPSVEESFGLVLAEAMALGVPVVAGRESGAVPWLLAHGRAGMLADVGDPHALHAALRELLAARATRGTTLRAAHERVQALCAPQAVARAYVAAYRRAIELRQAPAAAHTPPLRVLHVLNELMPSGAEVMLRNAAPHWTRHGVQCQVLSLGAQPGPFADALAEAGYPVQHLPFAPTRRFLRDFEALLRAEGCDVVHLHVERASMWLALAARRAGVPRVVRTVHGNFLFEGWLRGRRMLSRAVTRLLGAHQVTISERVHETERTRFGNRTELIHNWFDSTRIAPPDPTQRAAARAALDVPDHAFVLLTVGNCAPVKNHPALLEALARLARRDWLYLHVGCEETGEPERALAQRLGIAAQVRFVGLQADVRPFLHAADLFVMPSLREGLGVACLEAVGAGLPALVGDVPGLRELRRHFGSLRTTGVDAQALAAALAQALQEHGPAQRAAVRGDAAIARERFGLERGVAAYVRAYRGGRDVASAAPPHAATAAG